MALQEQYIELPLTGGLDESANREGNVNGFLQLDNYDFRDSDSVARRYGFQRLATWTQYNEQGLVAAGDGLAVVSGAGFRPVMSDGTLGAQVPTYPLTSRSVRTLWSGARVLATDSACSTTYMFVASCVLVEGATTSWASSTTVRKIQWQILELATGVVANSGEITGSSVGAFNPRVVLDQGGSAFIMFWMEGTAAAAPVKYLTITPGIGNSPTTTTIDTGTTDTTLAMALDAVTIPGDKTYFAFVKPTGGNHIVVGKVAISNSLVTLDDTSTVATSSNHNVVAIVAHPSNNEVTVLYSGTSVRVDASVYPKTLASRTRNTTGVVTHSGGGGSLHLAAIIESTSTHVVRVVSGGDLGDLMVSTYDSSSGTVVAKPGLTGSTLVTKPFATSDGLDFLVGLAPWDSNLTGWPAVMAVSVAANPGVRYGQIAYDESIATNSLAFAYYAGPSSVSGDGQANAWRVVIPVTDETYDSASKGSLAFPVCRARVVELSAVASTPLPTAQLGRVGFVGGSVPRVWDGRAVSPAAFTASPAAPFVSVSGTGLTGAYSWCVVLEYTDATGNIQVSPPSPVYSLVMANQGASIALDFSTSEWASRTTRCKVYRTAAAGSTFNLIRTFVITAATATVTDTASDATISTAETIYTTGNVLDSALVPPLLSLIAHRNRLVGLNAMDPRTVFFSKETFDPFLPQWAAELSFRVDNSAGDPTALASIDDKILVFQADQIVGVNGQGPDATGGNGLFSLPEVVARGVGVNYANRGSVCVFPDGVMFRHRSGIYAINGQLQVQPIGLQIQRTLGNATVLSARYFPSRHQVWVFLDATTYTGSGNCPILVYDVRYGRWATFSCTTAAGSMTHARDGVEVNGVVYILDASGVNGVDAHLFKYNTARFYDTFDADAASYFPQSIQPGWFRGAGNSGYERLYRVGLHGELVAGSNMVITVATYTQKNEQAGKNPETPDNTYTFSGTTLSGLPGGGFSQTLRVVTQRCSAFRCKITITPTDTSPATNNAEGVHLTKLSYMYGVEPGKGKTPSGRKPSAS